MNSELEVTPLFEKLREADTRFVLNFGGAGSSKSHTQAQHEVILGLESCQKTLYLRKTAASLKDSVISLIVDQIIPDIGIGHLYNYNKSSQHLTNIKTGSEILFKGLDDPEKIKSIHGLTRVVLEEATEFTLEDFKQLNLRLRSNAGKLQIVLVFNPIDENHWIKKHFFDNFDPERMTIIHSTYLDNDFLPDDYVREIEQYKTDDFAYYEVYALGKWGKLDIGGEAYKSFDHIKNTTEKKYNKELPLHLSFDENVNPYLTLTIYQSDSPERAWQIDEICLEDPRNTLDETMREFCDRYEEHDLQMIIYGDATSKKSDTKLQKGQNFFTLAKDYLKREGFDVRDKVPASNPSVYARILFTNRVFAGRIEGVDFKLGRNCTNTISDYKYTKEAADGSKHKKKVKNQKTGVMYEEYGHCSDTGDYFMTVFFRSAFRRFTKGKQKDSVNYLAGKQRMIQAY